ncbi:cytochrome b561 [Atlantibacter sp.]|uniref:cytochrome b561 n=1 Tax=Atlantibacter sp. TaxID=1903473 RepID=UPI0028AF099F|nr:cytochrome b561 [Atlantibacter sp.]
MRSKYTSLQITLHWLVFLLVIVAYTAMELRSEFPRSVRPLVVSTHFSCGIAIFLLMATRLLLRIKYAAPPITPKPHPLFIGLSHLVHLLIYLIYLALPLLGVTLKYYGGSDWVAFGVSMPVAPEPDEDFADTLADYHGLIARLGYIVLGLHAGAALFHHYVWKDNTLLRMMPGKRS